MSSAIKRPVLTQEEFEKLIKATLEKNKNDSPKLRFIRFRNCLMFMFGYYMGLRNKEIRDSKISDINFEKKFLFIPTINNKQRQNDEMPIPDFIFKKIEIYLKIRSLYFNNSEWVFPSNFSKFGRIDRSTFARTMKKLSRKAGVYKTGMCPYSLRHSFGTNTYYKLRDLKSTSIMMRHKDLMMRTTAKYIHLCEDKLRTEIMEELYTKAR